jgi:tetratricopeptide (TPR) repeat protein
VLPIGRGCVATLLLAVCPAAAAEQWLRLKSPNFELLTTAGEKRAREAILHFEQVRGMFEKINGKPTAVTTPVRIIAFNSDKEFKPYATKEFSAAYYLGTRDRDYIVMRGVAPEFYQAATHEYTHLIVKHSGLPLPIWLNEGIAEVFSTMKPVGKQVRMGDVLPGRYQELQRNRMIGLAELLGAGHDSPHYNERQKAGVFYAQSWALAHMLYFSEAYRAHLGEFLKRVRADGTQPAVFQQVFGKSLEQVHDDLESYTRQAAYYAAVFDVKVEKSAEDPEIRPATPIESGLALADLLTVTRKRDEAKAAYEKLAAAYPRDPDVPAALARLSWMSADREGIRKHFARAIELGTRNAKIYYDYAGLLQESGAPAAESEEMLRKAVELDPELPDAYLRLGFYSMNAGRFGQAVVDLGQIKRIDRQNAFQYFRALGYAYYRLNNAAEAKKHTESALKYASDEREKQIAAQLLSILTRSTSQAAAAPRAPTSPESSDEPPRLQRRPVEDAAAALGPPVTRPIEQTYPVEGVLKQVDCIGARAVLRLTVGGKDLSYLIEDPSKVIITSALEGATHEFTCGPQKPARVALGYIIRQDAGPGVEGEVRTLEFR